jgi:putative cardiolipin synthase
MDNAIAIIGGRNIADHYFGVNEEENFRDLDIAAVGPVVRDISNSFDTFWNSNWAMPVDALLDADETISAEQYADNLAALRERLAATPYPYPLEFDVQIVADNIRSLPADFTWAEGRVIYDRPEEIATAEGTTGVISVIREQMDQTRGELLVEAAYFVPTDDGVERGCEMVERGVRVRVLTNSLASNDVAAAHAGYEKYRKRLLECGVELHELRIDSQDIRRDWSAIAITSKSLLHTKASVFDGERLFIGSMNFDPRSTDINTEMGLLVESAELAAQVTDYMNEGANERNSYTVRLDENSDLFWVATDADGQQVRYSKEPDTGALKRGTADFIKILPVESQL